MSRMDIVSPRTGSNGKTYFTKIGVAFANRSGNGWSLTFEALPLQSLNDKGQLECRALMMEPRERDDAPPARQPTVRARVDDLDDDPPF